MTVNNEETTEEVVEEVQNEAPVEENVENAEPSQEDADAALAAGEITQEQWDKFTYSVRDEEKEFDDIVKPLIKDEDSYKYFQDLFTARDGIGLAKEERDEVQEKLDTLNTSLNTVNKFVQQGDAASFIQALGLPKKMFIDYAINELKYQELPPEERARIDSENQERLRMHQLEIQNETLQSQYVSQQRAQRMMELDNGLQSPDILPLANEYDARVGKPGAFKQFTIDRGIYHHQVNNRDISATEAITESIELLGLKAVGTPNQNNVQAGTQGHQQVHPAQKPVIPNIQGRGTSPVGRRAPNSIDDIRQIRAERLAQQNL